MHSLFTTVAGFLCLTACLAAQGQLLTVQRFAGEIKPNSFIVKLKHGTDKAAHIAALKPQLKESQLTHDYDSDFINAFAGTFTKEDIDTFRASPDVEHIEEDGILHAMAITAQTDAPWGLSRLSQDAKVSGSASFTNYTYRYNSSAGSGVDVYGVDTGIFTDHSDFGGRATWGATFGPYADADGNGHGTHTAATAVGTRWGVAKAAHVIAVKVLSDQGSGAVSDIIAGLNFVSISAHASGRPSIVNLSIGGATSAALDSACTSLVNSGIHVTAAAGPGSPANVPSVNTIGASTFSDGAIDTGSSIDIFAPGQSIISAWIDSATATRSLTGSSTAAPHVAGLLAYFISVYGNGTPASLTSLLHTFGLDNILTGPVAARNELARNDIV